MPSWWLAGPPVLPAHPFNARNSGVCCVHARRAHGASHPIAETRKTDAHALAGANVLCALPREPGTGSPISAAHRCQPAAPQSRLGTLGRVSGRRPLGIGRRSLSGLSTAPRTQGRRDASSSEPPLERAGERAASLAVASTHTRRHSVCDQCFRPSAVTDSCWMEPGRMLRRQTMHTRSMVARLAWTSLGASGSVWCWSRARTR
jgi:hypothetical protein